VSHRAWLQYCFAFKMLTGLSLKGTVPATVMMLNFLFLVHSNFVWNDNF
jgi:hypothetical protein